MRIIHIGALGTLGKHIARTLKERHEIVTVGRSSGDFQADLTSLKSIRSMYDKAGHFDAVICTAGSGFFGPFTEMKDEAFRQGINSKLMGQVNLVLEGFERINDNGSFTLTTGILSDDPVPMAANLSTVNGAINAFVRSSAIEMPRGIRINAVSPGLVIESLADLGPYFPGHVPVTMERMVSGYLKAVEGRQTGQVIKIY